MNQVLLKKAFSLGLHWKHLVVIVVLCTMAISVKAQSNVSGRVTSGEDASPLPGVNILVKGSTEGTITDADGRYSVRIPSQDAVLVFSFVGYITQEAPVNGRTTVDMVLPTDAKQLSEVVVTALGIEREKKALGYATQVVQGEDITQARESNLVNSLSGKVAGLQVVNSGSTIGGSARVTIRGESSLKINSNQPLFIVNGIPISNEVVGASGYNNLEVDYGNGAGEINPDDIESINILKGPAAAALYGARAANGAIIITTKSGKGKKGLGISVNSNVTFEKPLVLPDWQDTYGQGNNGQFAFVDGAGSGIADGVDESWGPRLNGQLIPQFDSPRDVDGFRGGDLNAPGGSTITPTPWVSRPGNIDEFFETGKTVTNSVAVASSGDFGNVRFSWTNMDQTGILPNTDLKRNTLALNGSLKLTDRLTVSTSVNYINTASKNRPALSYGTESIMYLWIWYGRQINTLNLRDYWMPGLENIQQFNYNYNYHDNPYFTMFENTNAQEKDRVLGNVQANYKLTDKLNLMVRTGTDFYNELRPRKRAFSTQRFAKGMYREDDIFFMERNSDFLLSYNDALLSDDWSLNVSFGGNQMKQIQKYQETVAPELLIPNLYNFSNSAVQLQVQERNSEKRINSLYGYAQVGYKNMIFLDLTGRNDWSSTLPVKNNSYFYPSATLSAVISDMVTLPAVIDFAKVRVAYAEVGNDTDPYTLVNVFQASTPFGGSQAKRESSVLANPDLKPERTASIEVGTDIRLFNDRIGLDFTYYRNITRNQILNVALDVSSGYSERRINAGEIENNGIEVMLRGKPIKSDNGFNWDVNFNFTRNRSKVLELAEGIQAHTLTERNGAFVQARVNQRMGDIYGVGFLRVEDESSPYFGQIIHSAEGTPLRGTDLVYQGNYNPDWMLGIQNNLSFKGVSLSFLFDVRQGGIVVSRTKTIGSTSGQLAETLYGRKNGYDLSDPENGIISPGVIANGDGTFRPNDIKITSRNWHNRYYERNNVEAAKYDASYVKLRELRLGYTLPNSMIGRLPFRNVNISVVGRNLLLWTENPHFDPDVLAMSGGTLQPGIENMAYPSTRSIGFNLSFNL